MTVLRYEINKNTDDLKYNTIDENYFEHTVKNFKKNNKNFYYLNNSACGFDWYFVVIFTLI